MIAYVYKQRRKEGGKAVAGRIWRARLKLNGDVKARDISLGVSDKQVVEQKLRDAIREHERTAVGMMAPAAPLPSFGLASQQNQRSQIDSQNLGAGSLSVSAAVAKNKTKKTDKTPVNIGESQSQSQPVAMGHGEADWRRGAD